MGDCLSNLKSLCAVWRGFCVHVFLYVSIYVSTYMHACMHIKEHY